MKKVLFSLLLMAAVCAQASIMTVPSGYKVTEITVDDNDGVYVSGFGRLSSGDFVIYNGVELYEIDGATGEYTKTLAETSPVYGSFVKVVGDKVYFGESSKGAVNVYDYATGETTLFTTLAGNYDMKVAGDDIYIIAGNTVNKVAADGTATPVITVGSASGALIFDDAGNAYYAAGEENWGAQGAKNMYKFTARQLASGNVLTEADGEIVLAAIDGPSGGDFVWDDLFYTDIVVSPSGVYNSQGKFADAGSAYPMLMYANGDGFDVLLTSYDSSWNSVYTLATVTAEVPEPGTLIALITGVAGAAFFGRRTLVK